MDLSSEHLHLHMKGVHPEFQRGLIRLPLFLECCAEELVLVCDENQCQEGEIKMMGFLDRSCRAMLRSQGSVCYAAHLERDHLQRKTEGILFKGSLFGDILLGAGNIYSRIGDAVVF